MEATVVGSRPDVIGAVIDDTVAVAVVVDYAVAVVVDAIAVVVDVSASAVVLLFLQLLLWVL